MESFTAFRLGLCALVLFVAVPVQAQTELYRFPDAPRVVVFRSTDPAPVAVPSVVEVPLSSVPTTVLMPPVVDAEPTGVTVYAPVIPPLAASDWTPVTPAAPAPDGVTVYSPVVPPVPAVTTVYQMYRPTVTYQPVVVPQAVPGAVVPATSAVPVGPRVTVRPKVYIQGQPLRNLFRAITP